MPSDQGSMHQDALLSLSASELSRQLHAKELSCKDVMAAYLAHIDAANPVVNAIVSRRDPDLLMDEAGECDRELAAGRSRGWLHGIPQAIKDLSATRDMPTSMGSPLFAGQVPEQDGIMVERMRRAGAIFIGKTNTPEFGLGSHTYNQVFGATRNAYDPRLCAGGSSGGAAAALAMRMLPVADGSDMMGSLRNPAAYHNVFGLRPSFGRVPHGPGPEIFGHQLATEGPMGRTVEDVARLLATQAGAHPSAPLSLQDDPASLAGPLAQEDAIKGLRIGWLGDWQGHLAMEQGVLEVCQGALAVFEDLGARVEALDPGFDPARLWQSWLVLRQWAIAGSLSEVWQDVSRRDALKPEAQWEIEQGMQRSALDVHRANVARSAWHARLLELFQQYDALVLPSAQVFAFDVETPWPPQIAGRTMDTYHRWMEVVIAGSLSGCPVINLPAGFDARGRAMGIQVIAPHRQDLALLRWAHAFEQAGPDWLTREPNWRHLAN
ncbi:amidase [Halomonas sp. DP8Y7-1]|uniref:amidase n=1 Tax=Halomonas sp. DP8Y7-1 TaxID=2859078 RepID=UPI001C96CC51|nr:amidase [Halomonas sp. DP8Y7-1]MBY6028606.1 amidase [Halomonas sp. DP8Y7-1]